MGMLKAFNTRKQRKNGKRKERIVARNSRDIIILGQQETTRLFWDTETVNYDMYISQAVYDECKKGDAFLAQKRLDLIKPLKYLNYGDEIKMLAEVYLQLLGIPEKAKLGAMHLAYTVLYKIDILLSWNCKHLVSPIIAEKIRNYNGKNNLWEPFFYTPNKLIGGDGYVQE